METKNQFYFAYASNMESGQMTQRCPGAIFVEKCYLLCYRFSIDSAGVATIIPDSFSAVEGVLWRVGEQELQQLDSYEGVAQGCYRRELITVSRWHDDNVDAEVYISNRAERAAADATGSPYMKRIFTVAEALGFKTHYLRMLELYAHA